ncbi:TetR/AcrR family transcriptional regulator [Mycolicibacterium sp. XJ1819]
MTPSESMRRPGYAPANAAVGRRGLHTRQRVLTRAGQLFVAHGFHGTSMDAIAKAVGGSRATIYQYFEDKEEIFRELSRQCEPAVLEHGRRLGELGPHPEGMANLHGWLVEWAELYDKYAVVFLEFPGIGTIAGVTGAAAVSDKYADTVTAKLRDAGVRGIDPEDAAAALLRIAHMVNLYRFRGQLGLNSRSNTSAALSIAIQLLLFPDTPAEVTAAVATDSASVTTVFPTAFPLDTATDDDRDAEGPPVQRDVLTAASALFAHHGYYSVSMEDIAAAAEVSRATLYRHFSSKVKVLAGLTDWAVAESRHIAARLHTLAQGEPTAEDLRAWLTQFVAFQRTYGGVTRAWHDGTLAQQLPVDVLTEGTGAIHGAVMALLDHVDLPAGLDPLVAVAIFLAVLGRLSELSASRHPERSDEDTAALMLDVLQRCHIARP